MEEEDANVLNETFCEVKEAMAINSSLVFGISSLNANSDAAYLLRGWVSCFVCAFGLVGNILSASVLTRPAMRVLPINVILLFLTACDSIYILLYLISWSIPTIIAREAMMAGSDMVQFDNYFMTHWRPMAYPYLYPLLWTAQNASIGFTLFLTIERYIYVCKPLESSKIINRRKTVIIAFFILIGFIIYELPLWWRFETIAISDEVLAHCPSPGHYIVRKNPAMKASAVMRVYMSKFKILVLHYVIPLGILFYLNWKIWFALKAIEQRRRRITSSEARNISYTKIVIWVISLSCLTDIVFAVVAIVGYFRDEEHRLYSHFVYVLLKDITDLLLLTNSSVNFVFYCLLGMAFKQEFLRMYCPFSCMQTTVSPEVSEAHGPGSMRHKSQKHQQIPTAPENIDKQIA